MSLYVYRENILRAKKRKRGTEGMISPAVTRKQMTVSRTPARTTPAPLPNDGAVFRGTCEIPERIRVILFENKEQYEEILHEIQAGKEPIH